MQIRARNIDVIDKGRLGKQETVKTSEASVMTSFEYAPVSKQEKKQAENSRPPKFKKFVKVFEVLRQHDSDCAYAADLAAVFDGIEFPKFESPLENISLKDFLEWVERTIFAEPLQLLSPESKDEDEDTSHDTLTASESSSDSESDDEEQNTGDKVKRMILEESTAPKHRETPSGASFAKEPSTSGELQVPRVRLSSPTKSPKKGIAKKRDDAHYKYC